MAINNNYHAPSIKNSLLILLGILAMAFAFHDALVAMFDAWQKEEYSHGYLIPIVAIVLLLNKMNDEKILPQNSWAGFVIMLFCILSQLAFSIAGINGLQPQVLILFIISFFVLMYGVRSSYLVAGPLLFLIFAAPLPKFLYYTISFNMQMLSTSLGAQLLELVGVSIYQEGNIIDLGGYQLQVVEACNGLRYLFPLMALGFLLAYMYKASALKRAILFLSTLPISIIMNGLRIGLIGVTVDLWGKEMAEGIIHDLEGWMMFMGCALILMLEILLMQKIGAKGVFDFDCIRLPSIKTLPAPSFGRPSKAAIVILVLALITGAAGQGFSSGHVKPVPLQKPFSEFPMQIGEWTGRMVKMDEKTLEVLGTNDYLLADFVNPEGKMVNLYVLYYPQQDSTSNQAVHSPTVCIPGGGWEILSNTANKITQKNGSTLDVNRLTISKGSEKQMVYYWFFQDGEAIANPTASRLAVIKRAMLQGRTNGALIRLSTPISANESETNAEERLAAFWHDTGADVESPINKVR